MKDTLELPIRVNLDLHFGRLTPLNDNSHDRSLLIQSASRLEQHISAGLLNGTDPADIDTDIQRYIFNGNNALPAWLCNKAMIVCDGSSQRMETAIRNLLANDFDRRRFLDYICGELAYSCWRWLDDENKRHWIVKRTAELCENAYCLELNQSDFVHKIGNGLLGPNVNRDCELYRWYISSLGTINLLDCGTRPVYEYTARLLEAKYKTCFILDVFKKCFGAAAREPGLEQWAVLVLGDIPKLFSLSDFLARAPRCQGLARTCPSLTDLLGLALSCFDAPEACPSPEARFRLGTRPPQALLNRVGAMFWLRRTLDAVKTIQQRRQPPQQGLRVEERSFLTLAMKQQCLLYCNLFDERIDPVINPCSIQAIHDQGMVLQSSPGNKLNDSRAGQEIHGYFSVVDGKRKSTYCDFRTTVRSIRPVEDGSALVDIAFPAAFELTRRSHKRLRLNASQLLGFSLVVPPVAADATARGNLSAWPEPLFRLPDQADLGAIKDLSAGGLMLELHEDAPAFDFFVEENRNVPLLALLHLAGQQNLPELRLPLCLSLKRIRHYAPLRKKYLGLQFTEAGEIRNQKYLRWQPVGKDGVFLVADWIFRDAISH